MQGPISLVHGQWSTCQRAILLILFSVALAGCAAVASRSEDVDSDAELERLFADEGIAIAAPKATPRPAGAPRTLAASTRELREPELAGAAAPEHNLPMFATDEEGRPGLDIYFFSIGQADSMLLVGPPPGNRTLLVDLGETNWNSRRNCLAVRDKIIEITGKAAVDYALLTHFHLDHTGHPRTVDSRGRESQPGGIFCLLDNGGGWFQIGTLIDPGDGDIAYDIERQTSHQALIDGASKWKSDGTLGERVPANFMPGAINVGSGVDVEVLAAAGRVATSDPGALHEVEELEPGTYRHGQEASPNDFSIALEITVGDFEMFTGGDLNGAPGEPPYPKTTIRTFPGGRGEVYTNVESYMVRGWKQNNRESDVEVYRANHHGSSYSSTKDLADALEPEVVIYSAGGKHRHPTKDTVDRFAAMGADQLVTHSADPDEWPDGFPQVYGNGWDNPTGSIHIFVPMTGEEYAISTAEQSWIYPTSTDAEEQ